MEKIKIKKFDLGKLFLGTLSLSIIPMIIFTIITFATTPKNSNTIIYCMFGIIIGPVIYGAVVILFGISYNWLSPKMGQFEIDIEKENKENVPQKVET
ncbi:MAG: hypothetical protein AB9856_00995 [Cellulosilyticaceae bacterium]